MKAFEKKPITQDGYQLPDWLPFCKTLKQSCSFQGIGVHSGQVICMVLKPAPLNTGIVFIRTDVDFEKSQIKAVYDQVVDTRMSTTVSNAFGITVSTVEHLLAALEGSGITDVLIELSGAEVPIMDGSAEPFIQEIQKVGCETFHQKRHCFYVTKPVRVEAEQGYAEFVPCLERRFVIEYDFCGRFNDTSFAKNFTFHLDHDLFSKTLSNARTFGLYEDGVRLQKLGLAKGASLENTVVLKEMTVMNEEGLRSNDEFVRHKVLDAIGDMALAGKMIFGQYNAHNPSHALNNALLHALFSKN